MSTRRSIPTSPSPTHDPLGERTSFLIERTGAFCAAHLDAEFGALCERLIRKMRRMRTVPFATGRAEIWAATVVYALAQISHVFDRGRPAHTSLDAIATLFAVSTTTVGLEAQALRDTLGLRPFDPRFSWRGHATRDPARRADRLLASSAPTLLVPSPERPARRP